MSAAPVSLPPNAPDDLTLEIDGAAVSGWTEISVTRSIERVVSSFEIAMTDRIGAKGVIAKPGVACRVLLGKDVVLTGFVDRFSPEITAQAHTIRVSGRGKLQDIVDCSATFPPGQQLMNGTLKTIAEQLLSVFDLKVIAQTDTGGVVPKQIVNIGDTPFNVLEPIAQYRAVLMYESVNGDLVFSAVGTEVHDGAIVEGKNVEAAAITYSMDQRYSVYSAHRVKLATFKDVSQESNLIADIQDAGVPRYRPKAFVADTFSGGYDVAKRQALWDALRRLGRSAAVHVVVDGWRDALGKLWTPNKLVTLKLPSLNLAEAQWLIGEVLYTRGPGGTHAHLLVMHPDAFAPKPESLLKISNALAGNLAKAAAQVDAEKRRSSQ